MEAGGLLGGNLTAPRGQKANGRGIPGFETVKQPLQQCRRTDSERGGLPAPRSRYKDTHTRTHEHERGRERERQRYWKSVTLLSVITWVESYRNQNTDLWLRKTAYFPLSLDSQNNGNLLHRLTLLKVGKV